MAGVTLHFEGIVMDCLYDGEGTVTSFLCVPANRCLVGHPLCICCIIKTQPPSRIGSEVVFPGVLVRGAAYELADYEEEGVLDVWVAPSDVNIVTEKEQCLALRDALLDPLLDAAMLGRNRWFFIQTNTKILPRNLLLSCLHELERENRLQPGRLTRHVHGWLSGYWLTGFSEKNTGIPGLSIGAAVYKVGGTPRIFICPQGMLREEFRARMFSVSVSPRPRVLEGDVFVPEETLALCLAWVRLNRKSLLKHWRTKIDSCALLDRVFPLHFGTRPVDAEE